MGVENVTKCMDNVRQERLDSNGQPVVTGVALEDACIVVLDLESIHEDARGFRRGFLGTLGHLLLEIIFLYSLVLLVVWDNGLPVVFLMLIVGMAGYPYGFLSPGQYDIAIRFDVEDFGIHSTHALPLREVHPSFGGYSGGFRGD